MEPRQSGRTSRQMVAAPPGAFFIWCNSKLHYPEALAHHLGRRDLQIRGLGWLQWHNLTSRNISGVVLDHAADPGEEGHEACQFLVRRNIPVFW